MVLAARAVTRDKPSVRRVDRVENGAILALTRGDPLLAGVAPHNLFGWGTLDSVNRQRDVAPGG